MTRRLPPVPILLVALAVPLISLFPAWQAWHAQQPPDRVFMGFRYMAGDHYQYAAFMREAHDGVGLFMRNPFTNDPQRGAFVLPYFWLLGVLSRLNGGGVALWWEVFRVLGGALYILAFWRFAGLYLDKDRHRLLATLAFCFAGGLDWVVTLARLAGLTVLKPLEYPYDFFWNWSTFGAMQVPNWIWPALLMLLAGQTALGERRGRAAILFVLAPAIWFLHAYSGMVAYLAFGLLPVVPAALALIGAPAGAAPSSKGGPETVPWPRVAGNLRRAAPALASFAVVAAYLIWARGDPVFRAGSERGFTWTNSFSVWWYPLSYGLLLPPAWFGLRALARERTPRADFLIAWLAAAIALSTNSLYAGVKFQYLIFPPLVILAARGAIVLHETTRFGRRLASSRARAALVGAALCLNAPICLVKDLPAVRTDRDIYMSAPEIEAMTWLGRQPDGSVLSTYRDGNRIPWLSGKPVFIGHWFMTPDLDLKARNVAALLSPEVPARIKTQILAASGARYLYLGPDSAAGFDDSALPLRRIYDAGGCRIYTIEAR